MGKVVSPSRGFLLFENAALLATLVKQDECVLFVDATFSISPPYFPQV